MKKTYKLDICGRISTFYEDTVFVLAESEQEANLMGVEAFRDIVQERFNFADVEVVSVKGVYRMSVDYESALIYGWDCSRIQEDWPHEATERMEEFGFDVIRDGYSEKFLYIGKCISQTSCGEEARVDCLQYLDQTEIDVECMLREVPKELKRNLPLFPSIYHLCYAT